VKIKIRIRDEHEHPGSYSESLEKILWVKILKFFDADSDPRIFLTLDPGTGMEKIRIRYPEPGINIPDLHHCCPGFEFRRG
jgi:hypothetical protein